jgi:hypothetical protein
MHTLMLPHLAASPPIFSTANPTRLLRSPHLNVPCTSVPLRAPPPAAVHACAAAAAARPSPPLSQDCDAQRLDLPPIRNCDKIWTLVRVRSGCSCRSALALLNVSRPAAIICDTLTQAARSPFFPLQPMKPSSSLRHCVFVSRRLLSQASPYRPPQVFGPNHTTQNP